MLEYFIFGNLEEMKKTLEQLLLDFPNARLSKANTDAKSLQVCVDIEHIDNLELLGWAVSTNNVGYCFSLVLLLLEDPRPEWIERFLHRLNQ